MSNKEMYVLFNNETLKPIQFSYNCELLHAVVELLGAHFIGQYEVSNEDYYTDLVSNQNKADGLLEGL
ncbi:baseplate central spike complex protein [Proteus phage 309]|uniref:Baseplate central spike complex protein n=1 Tax=Proteus phage 309 TaxID=2894355 RepID=A0AAE8YHM5_9CAUD|nr:baseplate central spike complex protein [Proteus phage 309]